MDSSAEPTEVVQVLFRPVKKRKIYRHRSEENEGATANDSVGPSDAPSTTATIPAAPTVADDDDASPSVSEALRLRNLRKHRNGGVAFRARPPSNGDNGGATDGNMERGLVLRSGADEAQQEESMILGGINRRFAAQTGLVGELVNKHMEEYVESELARRKRHAVEASAQNQPVDDPSATAASGSGQTPTVPGKQVESQRVLHGKLLEIDLGEEARARNVEMTERARRRLEGLAADEGETSGPRQKKARLGPDGKPWRSRKRRGSEDIKRDQLVEKILSENKLDVYDLQPEQPTSFEGFDDEEMAADDRIAEEFKREFMDAMSQRRRRKAVQPPKPGSKEEEVLKGPKLGGSRNARAAMRDILLKEQEKKKRW
ncbi:hypothetical protein OQA88_6791 [Cercophora sp. LCS_1]